METTKPKDFSESVREEGWMYIKTIADVVREPILILDKEFRVIAANESFCSMFQVEPKNTEGQIVYELGNGQWNIPALRKLIEDILPKHTFFKGFEVTHNFPFIGRKVMLLNARQIHFKDNIISNKFPSIILLAMEDVTDMMVVAETLADQANGLEVKFMEKAGKLETRILKLEKDISILKNKAQNQ